MTRHHPDPIWFDSADEFRTWLEENHQTSPEVIVGFYKARVRNSRMTWSEAVDQALCFGWIDSIGRRIDDERRTVRFSPRRPGSNWSKVNIAKVAALQEQGLMHPAGLEAFARRREDRSGVYSHERETAAALDADMDRQLRANAAAWDYFSNRAPWYQRAAIHWVMSAKREETRQRRFGQLLQGSADRLDVPPLRRR